MPVSRLYLQHIRDGLCGSCGQSPPTGKTKLCQRCRDRLHERSAIRRVERVEAGFCYMCGKAPPASPDQPRCQSCIDRGADNLQKRRARYFASGQCTGCGDPAITNGRRSSYCLVCWLRDMAGHATKTTLLWKQVGQLLEAQQYRCAYTGEKLIPGVNASIDHIIPRSRGGSDELSNLQWVTLQINKIKRDLTHDEFIAMCHNISCRYPL